MIVREAEPRLQQRYVERRPLRFSNALPVREVPA
jgi:hypothetical protein